MIDKSGIDKLQKECKHLQVPRALVIPTIVKVNVC